MARKFESKVVNDCVIMINIPACFYAAANCTDCSCDQAKDLVEMCLHPVGFVSQYEALVLKYVEFAVITLGLINNSLLFLTLTRKKFRKNVTFDYIRIIALLSLLMICMQLSHKILCLLNVNCQVSSWSDATFVGTEVIISMCIKLTMFNLSVFLAFDRVIGVMMPHSYSKINSRRFLFCAFSCSCLVGIIPSISTFDTTFVYDQDAHAYWQRLGALRKYSFITVICIPLAIRLTQILLIVSFATCVVFALRRRKKRLANMSGAESLRKEHQQTANLSRFQILEALQTILDLLFLCAYDIFGLMPDPTFATDSFSFQQFAYTYNMVRGLFVFTIIRESPAQLSHFTLFFLYLAFSKTFRREVIQLFRGIFKHENLTSIRPLNQKL